jgi:hypothetical protein
VDFFDVPAATIAAALPRLHTLEASSNAIGVTPAAVAGFFDVLLPRLRVFHISGSWPLDEAEAPLAPQPRPLLQELQWRCPFLDDTKVARGFMGARPVAFTGSHTMIAEWLVADASQEWTPLARVRELHFTGRLGDRLNPVEVAQLLRAAPQLRRLHFGEFSIDLSTWSSDPSFESLTHLCLQSICFAGGYARRGVPLAVLHCAAELRRLHFPRLRYLRVGDVECPVDSSSP